MKEQETTYIEQSVSLLEGLGYKRLSQQAADLLRNGDKETPLLKGVLEAQIRNLNLFVFKGEEHSFSDNNIRSAISGLEELAANPAVASQKKIFDLLLLGRSYAELINSVKTSFTLKLIDWKNIWNNQFHVITEFPIVDKDKLARMDMTLFVNGIPLVILEYKPFSTVGVIYQLLRYQQIGEPAFKLFKYAQLLIAATQEEAKYGLPGDKAHHWSVWNEDSRKEEAFIDLLRTQNRLPTTLDQILYALCRPDRLLELISEYFLWQEGEKSIAKYYQYAAVKRTIQKIEQEGKNDKRQVGMISHIQSSGHILTMLLLARNILRKSMGNARIVILTDRSALEQQFVNTFKLYGEIIANPHSVRQLSTILEDDNVLVTVTTLQKIHLLAEDGYGNKSGDIFIMFDEMNRSHGVFHHEVQQIFPNARYIGFTQMPLESITNNFGSWDVIHAYSMKEAVNDGFLLPILFESRFFLSKRDLFVDNDFENALGSIPNALSGELAIRTIASDIAAHYSKYWKGSGLKAMLITTDQATAIRFQEYFDNALFEPRVNAATIIAGNRLTSGKWNDESYVVDKFNTDSEEVELLITVDKLLVGFDSPRLGILYIARNLQPSLLIQAIGRVNRTMPGKEVGLVVNYADISYNLEQVIRNYSTLESYRTAKEIVVSVQDSMLQLKKYYKDLEQLFFFMPDRNDLSKKDDLSLMEQFLISSGNQPFFLERVAAFDQAFRITMSSEERNKVYADFELNIYGQRLSFYKQLADRIKHGQKNAAKQEYRFNQSMGEIVSEQEMEYSPESKFFSALQDMLNVKNVLLDANIIETYSNSITHIVKTKLVRDWQFNKSVQSQMQNALEDLLINLKTKYELPLTYSDIDTLLETFIKIAKLEF